MIIDNLPFDKYELEPSPLTLFILGRKQPNYCWQVSQNSFKKNLIKKKISLDVFYSFTFTSLRVQLNWKAVGNYEMG